MIAKYINISKFGILRALYEGGSLESNVDRGPEIDRFQKTE